MQINYQCKADEPNFANSMQLVVVLAVGQIYQYLLEYNSLLYLLRAHQDSGAEKFCLAKNNVVGIGCRFTRLAVRCSFCSQSDNRSKYQRCELIIVQSELEYASGVSLELDDLCWLR